MKITDFQLPTPEDIHSAAERISPYINKTPILTCSTLDKRFGVQLFFKCENFQKAGAFKSRGAINAVFSLEEDDLKQGVCTHSSGNHAQALARAASLRNTPAYIVMPETSPVVKVNAVKNYGGQISFCKPTLRSREETLKEIVAKTGAVEIHPYDNLRIITGQATAALEVYEEINEPDFIIAPVGGGGLLSGTSLSTHYFSPKTHVIAAEPQNADDAYRSFYSGKFVPSINPDTIADGLLTSLGKFTFPIVLKYTKQVVTVSEKAIREAMRLVWERMKIIIEPSSAVPLAALLEKKFNFEGKRIVIILSGGNVDLDKLPWD